jgi:hypothetical protein
LQNTFAKVSEADVETMFAMERANKTMHAFLFALERVRIFWTGSGLPRAPTTKNVINRVAGTLSEANQRTSLLALRSIETISGPNSVTVAKWLETMNQMSPPNWHQSGAAKKKSENPKVVDPQKDKLQQKPVC